MLKASESRWMVRTGADGKRAASALTHGDAAPYRKASLPLGKLIKGGTAGFPSFCIGDGRLFLFLLAGRGT
ncbi:MAG: hypothetical protein K0R28_1719 [Paenibacillus sp.]|nr:hypothetical protein [Paenibacillus sp.]